MSATTPEDFLNTHGTIETVHAEVRIDLSILNGGQAPAPPLPRHLFGAWADWIALMAAAKNAPADYVAAGVLAAGGGVLGNGRWACAWPGFTQPPALWVANVGNPSSGKSPAADAVIDALRKMQQDELQAFDVEFRTFEEKLAAAKIAENAWCEECKKAADKGTRLPAKPRGAELPSQPNRPRCVVSDSTPEALTQILFENPRGVLLSRDELSGMLGGMNRYNGGDGERAMYVEAYGGGTYVVDRKGGGMLLIPNFTISILGGIQPDRFSALIAKTADDGLSARFLWVSPDPVRFRRPTQQCDHAQLGAALRRIRALSLRRDVNGNPEPLPITCTHEAAIILEQFCDAHSADNFEGGSLFKSWLGKGRGHVLRLSLVLEFLEWSYLGHGSPPDAISATYVARAVELYQTYFVPMARRVFGDAALPLSERDAGQIAKWIVASRISKFTPRDVYRMRIGGVADPKRAKDAIAYLQEAAWVTRAPSREGGSPGRQQEWFVVNPALWSQV
jgi:hypothetical protein